MPQANNNVQHQQWAMCDQCGFMYPMSRLVKQKGLLVCTERHCFDNLTVERRERMIAETLNAGADQEAVDLRYVDRGFFEGTDEVNA